MSQIQQKTSSNTLVFAGGTRLIYSMTMAPASDAPAFLLAGLDGTRFLLAPGLKTTSRSFSSMRSGMRAHNPRTVTAQTE